jgi:selenide,water dikinase
VLVGTDAFADAGVIRVREDLALVQSCDFFTPIVDDPRDFGEIAAANAFSDLYAMGAEPLSALNVVCFPEHGLDFEVLGRILQGGEAKAREAGAAVLGGHSVRDEEIKYGMAVTGTVDPRQLFGNDGARDGDVLLLTKPLGTGILTTALKQGRLDAAAIAPAVEGMKRLNRAAGSAVRAAAAHAVTDVTGFGLAGHAWQMAEASGLALEIEWSRVPLYPRAAEQAREDVDTGGGRANAAFYGDHVQLGVGLPREAATLLYDPQTSGGLLVALAPAAAEPFRAALAGAGEEARVVGRAVAGDPGLRVV